MRGRKRCHFGLGKSWFTIGLALISRVADFGAPAGAASVGPWLLETPYYSVVVVLVGACCLLRASLFLSSPRREIFAVLVSGQPATALIERGDEISDENRTLEAPWDRTRRRDQGRGKKMFFRLTANKCRRDAETNLRVVGFCAACGGSSQRAWLHRL